MVAVSIAALPTQPPGDSLNPPAGSRAVLQAKGEGVQIYVCSSANGGFKWKLDSPDAELLDPSGKIIGSHFAGPTWRLLDGSQVVGELIASKPAPESTSVAWLLLRSKVGTAAGRFASVKFIQRTETHGGVAASSDCQNLQDSGKTVRIPYSATYTFYQ